MRKIVFILAFSLLFSACEPVVVRQGRVIYKAYFDYILKDPESLEIHKEEYTIVNEREVEWKLDYSAKNSLGGRVREDIEFTTNGGFYIKLSPLYGGDSYFWEDLH